MYSNRQKASVLARGFLTSLGATPSKSLPSRISPPSCFTIGCSLWLASLLWKFMCTWMLVRIISKGWVENVEIIPDPIPATTELKPRLLPFSYRVQYRPAKHAYFQHEAAHPLKNPCIPSIAQIRCKFLAMLPDHFSTPESSYLASITPRGLATTALAILARAEDVKLPAALLSGTSFSMYLSRQKYTALLMPVLMALTSSPLQKAVQPSSARMYAKAKYMFFRKLFDRVSLLGGTIRAIFMLSRGWSTAAVVVPARYPQYPFFLPIAHNFNLIMLYTANFISFYQSIFALHKNSLPLLQLPFQIANQTLETKESSFKNASSRQPFPNRTT